MTQEQRELFATVVKNNAEALCSSLIVNAPHPAILDGTTIRTDDEVLELARESFRKSILKRLYEQSNGWNIY